MAKNKNYSQNINVQDSVTKVVDEKIENIVEKHTEPVEVVETPVVQEEVKVVTPVVKETKPIINDVPVIKEKVTETITGDFKVGTVLRNGEVINCVGAFDIAKDAYRCAKKHAEETGVVYHVYDKQHKAIYSTKR